MMPINPNILLFIFVKMELSFGESRGLKSYAINGLMFSVLLSPETFFV